MDVSGAYQGHIRDAPPNGNHNPPAKQNKTKIHTQTKTKLSPQCPTTDDPNHSNTKSTTANSDCKVIAYNRMNAHSI